MWFDAGSVENVALIVAARNTMLRLLTAIESIREMADHRTMTHPNCMRLNCSDCVRRDLMTTITTILTENLAPRPRTPRQT